jgi:predicted nucleic acid-binding protein
VFSDHAIAICDQIVAEVRATLVRKFSWKDEEVLAILTEYTNDGKRVAVTGTLERVCRDAKDDMVFECAVKAEPMLLSADFDLVFRVPILLPP